MKGRDGVSIGNIIHPTDFSHGSDVAFGHALRLALGCHGQLEILHVDREQGRANWDSYPSVRETLSRWKLLPDDAKRSDVGKLGVNISKSASKGVEAATSVLEHIDRRGADLVVMATHRREGLDRWMYKSLAEQVSHRTEAATLFVPYGMNGFVALETGEVTLKRILIPVDSTTDAQPIVEAVAEIVDAICDADVEICLLHIGDPAAMPSLKLPSQDHCGWNWESRPGSVVEGIHDYAVQNNVDLIAMTTNGRDGFLDVIRGTTTERVLHQSQCPVLSIHQPDYSPR